VKLGVVQKKRIPRTNITQVKRPKNEISDAVNKDMGVAKVRIDAEELLRLDRKDVPWKLLHQSRGNLDKQEVEDRRWLASRDEGTAIQKKADDEEKDESNFKNKKQQK
jgi:hypothetical protein